MKKQRIKTLHLQRDATRDTRPRFPAKLPLAETRSEKCWEDFVGKNYFGEYVARPDRLKPTPL